MQVVSLPLLLTASSNPCLTVTTLVPGSVTVGGMDSMTAAEAVTMPWTVLLILAGENRCTDRLVVVTVQSVAGPQTVLLVLSMKVWCTRWLAAVTAEAVMMQQGMWQLGRRKHCRAFLMEGDKGGAKAARGTRSSSHCQAFG